MNKIEKAKKLIADAEKINLTADRYDNYNEIRDFLEKEGFRFVKELNDIEIRAFLEYDIEEKLPPIECFLFEKDDRKVIISLNLLNF